MKVNLAKNCGFCSGVHRAFSIVKKEFEGKAFKRRILILGSLVHNENVMGLVKQWGIKKVKTLRSAKAGDVVIITAHGVGKNVVEQVLAKRCELFDATCPRVSLIHKKVLDHHSKGHRIVIFGDRQHKEVKGINGWCDGKASLVSNLSDAKALSKKWATAKGGSPVVVVSQTTQNYDQYKKVCEILFKGAKTACRKIKSIDTICNATSFRQKEARQMARSNDAVVVVGGKKSANTKRLWHIAKSINPLTVWIEDLREDAIKKIKKITRKAKSVAVVSGASTPQWDIRKVAVFLQNGFSEPKDRRQKNY